MSIQLSILTTLTHLDLLHGVIGTQPCEHLPYHDAHTVNIGTFVVQITSQHLWRHPVNRAHIRCQNCVRENESKVRRNNLDTSL